MINKTPGIRELSLLEIEAVSGGISDKGLSAPNAVDMHVPSSIKIIAKAIPVSTVVKILNKIGDIAGGVIAASRAKPGPYMPHH